MTIAQTHAQALGEEDSIWFKLTALVTTDDPMSALVRLSEKYGGCIPVRLKNQKIWLLSDVDHFRHVLVGNAENYLKYFEGMKAIFGKSMITVDGVLWQKLRAPQQASFHPSRFEIYFPYLQRAVKSKVERWSELAKRGGEFELVEETWSLAADMVCKALFDRDMPYNPHVVFGAVKAYTDVMNHKSIRLRKVSGELKEITEEDAAKAIETWWEVPELVIGAAPRDHRQDTLLAALEAAEADPDCPEFDHQQVVDEMKQYLWAGTETTALTLAWAIYLTTKYPEVAEKIRREGEEAYGDREPTWEDLQKLTYTRSVLQETLRLYPPIWALIRVAAKDDTIGGHEIKAGDKVVLCTYVVHQNAKIWTDPQKFDPTRFSRERMRERPGYSYLPFSAGRRACVGGQLSLVENTLALTTLLRRFRPEFAGTEPVGMNATVTLTPKGGLPFRVHELS
jgi:cytochrome P450